MTLNHRLHSKLRRKHLFFGLFLRQLIFALLAFIRSELLYPKKVEQAKNGIYHKRVNSGDKRCQGIIFGTFLAKFDRYRLEIFQ